MGFQVLVVEFGGGVVLGRFTEWTLNEFHGVFLGVSSFRV